MPERKIINPLPPLAPDANLRAKVVHTHKVSAVDYLPQEGSIAKPLVVFIGGYCDASTRRFYNTALKYRDGSASDPDFSVAQDRLAEAGISSGSGASAYQDVYYRSHTSRSDILLLMTLYHAAGQKIALVGHSWGGATAYKLARRSPVTVDLLATLDPVSLFPLGKKHKPAKVLRWVNVRVDFKRVDMSNSSNLTAWIGRPWGSNNEADVSHDFMSLWPGEGPPGHAWCYEMFNLCVRTELEGIR